MDSIEATQEPAAGRPLSKRPLVLLVVSSPERSVCLQLLLKELNAECLCARRCSEARSFLAKSRPLSTVVTDTTLEDANWCDVVRAVVDQGSATRIVVVAPASADEVLWSEVLWRGVHDMLVEPFTNGEAKRVLKAALGAPAEKYVPALTASH